MKASDKKDYEKFENFLRTTPKDQESFEFEVNKDALGNPCWGGSKTLEIFYRCVSLDQYGREAFFSNPIFVTGKEDEKIRLDCRNHHRDDVKSF